MFNTVFNIAMTTATLAIKAGGSAIAKTSNAFRYFLNGTCYEGAAGDVSLTGISVATGYKQVVAVLANSAGTLSTKVSGDAILNASNFETKVFDVDYDGFSVVGYIIIKNATGSTFTGGTTALDTGSLTVEYINHSNPLTLGR